MRVIRVLDILLIHKPFWAGGGELLDLVVFWDEMGLGLGVQLGFVGGHRNLDFGRWIAMVQQLAVFLP